MPVRIVLLLACLIWPCAATGQTLEPIRYTLSFPAARAHYVEVEAVYPAGGRPHIDLMMAVWTPGSYLVREFARHVEDVRASDPAGAPLSIEKTRKNRWRVQTGGGRAVALRYRVYAHEMSVRTNWIDEEFALLNGAPTFITLVEPGARRAHEVTLRLPDAWGRSLSGLRAGQRPHSYIADDYDTLVDSPIMAGNPAVYEFTIDKVPHYLVNFRERGGWDGPRAAGDLERVVRSIAAFWGTLPFDRYYFFNIIGATSGGLEHLNSTVINAVRSATDTRETYLGWLGTASHEYLHAWNAKRLRPIELGPFDYENEVYTRSLWFTEGVTDYYADLFLARADVMTRDEYFEALSDQIRRLQTTPGRLVQSLEQASYDAWIKAYRPDENTPNTAISYYVKGAVVGFLLDAKLQRTTGGSRSLDDLMLAMYSRFSKGKGFTGRDLRDVAAEVAGPDHAAEIRAWLRDALETTRELDYAEALEWFGLQIVTAPEAPRGWVGMTTRSENGKTIVSEVRRGSPAAEAGMTLLDEITAVDGAPLKAGSLADHIRGTAPGTSIVVSIVRRDQPQLVTLVVGDDPADRWKVARAAGAGPQQAARIESWLRQ